MMHPFSNSVKGSRPWAFVVGVTDMIFGITGILLALLDRNGRHTILNPDEDLHGAPFLVRDAHKDTFQFFIEYWMPSLSLLLVGILVIWTSITRKPMVATVTFVMSTIQVAGFIAGLFALLLSGANRIGMIPFLLVTILQLYFHWIIALFTRFAWGAELREDTEDLIETSVNNLKNEQTVV